MGFTIYFKKIRVRGIFGMPNPNLFLEFLFKGILPSFSVFFYLRFSYFRFKHTNTKAVEIVAKTNVSSGSNVLFKIDDDLNRTMTFSAVSSLPMVNEIFSPDFLSFHIWKIHWISKL